MSLVKCTDLCKSFGEKKVLDGINLEIPEGKIIGLLGRNGTGKSTLIKLMCDLLTPTSGEITIDGHNVGIESKNIISYLPERIALNRGMSVDEVISYYKDFYDDFDEEKARRLLSDLGLDTKMKLSKMSKGMKEKVQLSLVMSRHAKLYILDEPMGGVDPATRDYILDTILTNFDEGASMLISTHLISDIERILDGVIMIDDGKIILEGDCDEIRDREGGSIDDIFRRMFRCS